MAKKQTDTVYKIVEVVGVSEKSWEDAGRNAVETAADSLRDLRIAEVIKMDMKVENGKVAAFRTRVSLSFKYEAISASQISARRCPDNGRAVRESGFTRRRAGTGDARRGGRISRGLGVNGGSPR